MVHKFLDRLTPWIDYDKTTPSPDLPVVVLNKISSTRHSPSCETFPLNTITHPFNIETILKGTNSATKPHVWNSGLGYDCIIQRAARTTQRPEYTNATTPPQRNSSLQQVATGNVKNVWL